MSQIGSHPAVSRNANPEIPSQEQAALRRCGYEGASYLLVLAAVWIYDTRTGGDTYLYLAIPALTLMFLASVAARGSVWLGWRSDRRVWRDGDRGIRDRSSAAGLLSGAGWRLTSEEFPLPAWIGAEPRVWHFAPLVLLVLWTLVALFRAS